MPGAPSPQLFYWDNAPVDTRSLASGFGHLILMGGGGKGKSDNKSSSELSIANKKFIHYNEDVYLPWIR